MTFVLLPALAAYIPRDRVENILRPGSSLPEDGVALIADISGFTPLTEALTRGLSPDQGAEELTRALSGVFTPLIAEIDAFRGSVIKFGGDALIVWYPRERGVRRAAVIRRAVTSAWRMQQAIQIHGQVPTPIGIVTLKMKIGLTYGPVKRFNLGLPEYGYEDALGGATLDRMAEAEHHANSGDIMLDAATLAYVSDAVTVAEWRDNFAAVSQLLRPARPKPWPPLTWPPEEESILIERLAAYVPQQIYQTLAAGRVQVAELKPVVSLFVQFHGIDYDSDPEVGPKLQTYFSAAQGVAARYGGRVNRLITGDKGSLIHVIFGAPRAVEEQEARAIRCALDLQAECGGLPFIAMQRIGVTSGRVFAGPIGSPNRRDYTTMGDSINLSARLMQNATDNQILLEKAVRDKLGPEFELADLGAIRVKGKSEPIPVFAALGVQALPERPARKETPVASPIFGRDQELAHLRRHITQLGTGQGKVILLTGDVGMGKTLLMDVLRAETFAAGQTGWADGICLAYGQTFSGYLFTDLLRDLLELPPGAGPAETSQYLRYFCQNLFGPARLESTYPYLARFLGLPLSGELAQRLEGLSGESVRWQLFELFSELFRRLLERGPWVLALDDLQWADPTSLQLVEAVLPLVFNQPLILLLAMRPERDRKAWSLRQEIVADMPEQAVDLTMGSLDREAATDLITHYAPQLPEPVIAYLLDKGGGNPLFLVEIMHTLAAQGWLAPDVDLNQIALDSLNLPDSVQGLLLAQIDRLAVEARHTLQMASVIGKSFLYRVLDAIAAGEAALDQQLATLETHEHIQKESQTEQDTAYAFRHVLIQESAYSTLLYERRRAYHRQVAEVLERLFPWHSGEQVGLLAFHYERADDLEQAISYYLQAADQSRLLYANEEAEGLYQKVLKLLDRLEAEGVEAQLDRRAKTYLKLAQVRANVLDFEGAQEFYNQAFDLLGQLETANLTLLGETPGEPPIFRASMFEPETLDPGLCGTTGAAEIINNLFEGLVDLDTELNVLPALARRWHVADEGKKYTFELRSNLQWSDGSPLTAHEFVFAWRRNLHPETNASMASQLYVVQGAEEFHQGQNPDPDLVKVRALDDLNLEVYLKTPAPYFPYLMASSISYPQPAHLIRAQREDWSKPQNLVCNGPFKVVTWQPGQEIHLEKNPFYHGLTAGNVKEVLLYLTTPSLEQYISGKIDWCPVWDQANLPIRYPDETLLVQYLTTYFLEFSCGYLPFNQRLMRQAFAKSINQRELVHVVWSDVQKPALGGVVPPGMPGHSPEIGLSFDPAAAQDLLRQAGFKSGTELPRLSLAVLSGFSTTPDYLQASWREHLGVQVQIIRDVPPEDIDAGLRQGSVQLGLSGWGVDYPDPDDILRVLFHGDSPANFLGWRNQQFDQWVEQAARLTDQPARLALYHQADRLLVAEDTAVVPLYYQQEYGLLRPGFRLEGAEKIIHGGTFRFKNIRAI
jgi:ABC-type oligopeptide transport system substrate-binding subunit/class 3 adenylate cyclase